MHKIKKLYRIWRYPVEFLVFGLFFHNRTATHGKIMLSDTDLIKHDESAPLITVTGNDGINEWGMPGSNGGHLELICDHQTLSGDILVDSISNINLNLRNNSTYTGTIKIVPNAENGTPYKTNADVFITVPSARVMV